MLKVLQLICIYRTQFLFLLRIFHFFYHITKLHQSFTFSIINFQVDLALWGHVHNYERTCAVYQGRCLLLPSKENGIDLYKSDSYRAPVHVVVGMGGFQLDAFAEVVSLISTFTYLRFP
jgi:hypothetical protein